MRDIACHLAVERGKSDWATADVHDVAIHGAVHGIDVEQVKRADTSTGFVPVKRRWVVEQTNGTLMLHRRLVREYESRPASSVSRTWWASTANLIFRKRRHGRLRNLPATTPERLAAWWVDAPLERRRELLALVLDHVIVKPSKRRGSRYLDTERLEFVWK